MSALGIDFANDNAEIKETLDNFLLFANDLEPNQLGIVYLLAWILVKVFCFDLGGIVLALSSGVLFDGVFRGAIFASLAATVGSAVSYYIAKLDTPVRDRALIILRQYPFLNGIKRVIAKDGVKAVFTLRVAPIIPIPIGAYNYLYSVLDVYFQDFVIGIFLGSFKPYLLDSYLGFYGKEVLDGFAGYGTVEDFILLVALLASVLVGLFTSQLAAESWNVVSAEMEEARKNKSTNDDFQLQPPSWFIESKLLFQETKRNADDMIEIEYETLHQNDIAGSIVRKVGDLDLAKNDSSVARRNWLKEIFSALVLPQALVEAFLKYSDPALGGRMTSISTLSTIKDDDSKETIQDVSTYKDRKSIHTKTGMRDEIFFVLQLVILLGIFEGTVPFLGDALDFLLGPGLVISGLSLIATGLSEMGENISLWTTPTREGSLVTKGVFNELRHPIYGGLNFLMTGISFCLDDAISFLLCFPLWLLLDATASKEEDELIKKFGSDYETYMENVRNKFVPEKMLNILPLSWWYLALPPL